MTAESVPIYFESGGDSLFGWLHRPAGDGVADVGLVVCNPFGYEAICAHRPIRAFALALSALGIPVLRFDYSGTGDSTGVLAQGEQITRWCADIAAAIDALRRATGVSRVCLLGIRLGALLAGLAAAQREVEAIAAIVPVVSGRLYQRELRAFQAAANAGAQAGHPAAGLEVTGFSLSPASLARLATIDLASAPASAARVLILDRDDVPVAGGWKKALARGGAAVEYHCLPGFLEMMSTPHAAEIPQRMVDATVGWMRGMIGSSRPAQTGEGSRPYPAKTAFRLAGDPQPLIEEHACHVDDDRTLFAVLTAAAGERCAGTPAHGVVLLNCGATSHVGPNRMHVELARQWAARGHVVLRLDLPGLGDSAARAGRPATEVYPPDAAVDVGRAVEYLRRTRGVSGVTLVGVCSGAYHALRSALAGVEADALLMINPLTFRWQPGSSLGDLQISEVVRNPGIYLGRLWDLAAWHRLLRGRVNLGRIALIYGRRVALGIERALRDVGRRLHLHLPNDLGRELESLADRGVRIVFFFARGDGGQELLDMQAGAMLGRLGDRCRIHTIEAADHIFSQSVPRQELIRWLDRELPAPGARESP